MEKEQQPGVKIVATLPVPHLLLVSILGPAVVHSAVINSTPLQYLTAHKQLKGALCPLTEALQSLCDGESCAPVKTPV